VNSLLFDSAQRLVDLQSYYERSASIGVVAVLLLLVLLVEREVLRALDDDRGRSAARTLGIAIEPLLLTFVVIVAVRLVILL
jgi:hypothetical protein